MSVLIKGMKMPENCLNCPMQFGGWCYVAPAEIDERVAPTVDEAWEQGKPDWCPLVEVPEKHGRLIDSEEFKNILTLGVVTAQMLGSEENTCSDIQFMKEILDEVPTVIEAEE